MYAAIRRYKVQSGTLSEIAQRAQQGFVPLVSQIPGFVGYYGIDAGNDVVVTISLFQDQAGKRNRPGEPRTGSGKMWPSSSREELRLLLAR